MKAKMARRRTETKTQWMINDDAVLVIHVRGECHTYLVPRVTINILKETASDDRRRQRYPSAMRPIGDNRDSTAARVGSLLKRRNSYKE